MIVTALGQPESDLDHLHNWFHTDMVPLQPMVCIQCYLLGEYIRSGNYAPDDLKCASSITANEVEVWS